MKHTYRQLKQVAGALLALALAAPLVASAQPLDGAWISHGNLNGVPCTVQTVMNSGNYSELVQCGSLMSWQAGTYVFSGGVLVRSVMNWEPRQHSVYHGASPWSPRFGDVRRGRPYVTSENTPKPPGGSFEVTFTSLNTMVWRDVSLHGVETFQRVRQGWASTTAKHLSIVCGPITR